MPDETPEPTDEELPAGETEPAGGVDGAEQPPDDPASVLADDAIGRPDTLPRDVVDEAERLTRLAREAAVDAEREAYLDHREALLADHDYTARVRADDTRDVLVLHPERWVEEGTIRTERVADVDRGIEVPLSGPGTGDDWAEIDAYNRAIVETVREEHGETHAANAAALADFAGNHYAKPITELAAPELREFAEDYFRRNAWPTDEQRDVLEKSVGLAFDVADEREPSWRRR
ncbi:MAG: rnhA operon protein [Haloarculaceae archaeon]